MLCCQPLLDVDHTSARLNLLTPRYVNQKGVALPTSSALTRRAKRENLQQKQILVPELCDVHPFPASLWRKAVCLPAMLYRLNSLLIAEELRRCIAAEARIGSVDGKPNELDSCPALRFGFCKITQSSIKPQEQTALCQGYCQSSDNSAVSCQPTDSLLQATGDTHSNSDSEEKVVRTVKDCSDSDNHVNCGYSRNQSTDKCRSCTTAVCDDDRCPDTMNSKCVERNISELEKVNGIISSTCRNCCCVANSTLHTVSTGDCQECTAISDACDDAASSFSLDADTSLSGGPSPCDVIQALTMSNANDFFNLERLETIGDSFLKFAISIYLYCMYPGIHEGKLSYLRSIQVSYLFFVQVDFLAVFRSINFYLCYI